MLALALAAPAISEVRMVIQPDGTRVMYNQGSTRSTRPVPAPVASMPSAELDRLIRVHAQRRSLDPDLVNAVVQVESGFRSEALSAKGAMGLMQLMPETAELMGVSDPWDPEQNLRGGTGYLRRMLDLFEGSLELALAGYNAGPEAVSRHGGIPPYQETRAFVERVLRIYRGEPGFVLPPGSERRGRKTFLRRDREGRLVLTTSIADELDSQRSLRAAGSGS